MQEGSCRNERKDLQKSEIQKIQLQLKKCRNAAAENAEIQTKNTMHTY
jgi:hypothetical protein